MLSNTDIRFMETAKKLAIPLEPIGGSKISSIVAIKSQLISVGHNQRRTHPFQAKYGKNNQSIYLHAETNAIYNAIKAIGASELAYSTLYVHRVKRPDKGANTWVDGMACPCVGCAGAISEFRIKKVVFSTNIDKEYDVRYRCD